MPKPEEQEQLEHAQARVEAMGVFFEKLGYSPINGRVFALLLLAEPPYKDFYEIREFLAASKSSISNALNQLMQEGNVDYLTFSGDRRRYFRINTDNWLNHLKRQTQQMGQMRGILEQVLAERADTEYIEFNDGLQEIIDFQNFIAQGIELMIRKWEEREG